MTKLYFAGFLAALSLPVFAHSGRQTKAPASPDATRIFSAAEKSAPSAPASQENLKTSVAKDQDFSTEMKNRIKTSLSPEGGVCAYNPFDDFHLRGSLQSDILFPQEDKKIGTGKYEHSILSNSYATINLSNSFMDIGGRFEFTKYPLPGFEKDFGGWGFPFLYIRARMGGNELTIGDFYEQFGSGFLFRAYEERSLGIDNSLRGARLRLETKKEEVTLKLLAGKQRRYWTRNPSSIYGGDLSFNFNQMFPKMQAKDIYMSLGLSMVLKHEKPGNFLVLRPTGKKTPYGAPLIAPYRLKVPRNVPGYGARFNFNKGAFSLMTEYAVKGQDPSFDNHYAYRNGQSVLLSGSYSKKGLSLLAQAKRSEDMSFRSLRTERGISSFINHLPAFSIQQTYSLAALYPYATQNAPGEWAFQGTLNYQLKRHTALGGKYGAHIKVNASHIRGIKADSLIGQDGKPLTELAGTKGFRSSFFGMTRNVFYQDLDIQIEKKLSKKFKLSLMYMNQFYNKGIIEGHGGLIHSDIYIAEGKYRINSFLTLRGEAQYLHTDQDQKDWYFGLLELSVLPSFMFTVSDLYNAHTPAEAEGRFNAVHYYMLSASYTHGPHRLQLSYGKTRAGFNCSGGVCRYVPAQKGFFVSYNLNF